MKNNPRNDEKLTDIQSKRDQWSSFASKQIKKVMEEMQYIYDQDSEEAAIQFKGSLVNITPMTLSPIRAACNRAKTDMRDYQPFFECSPLKQLIDSKQIKLFQALLNALVFTDSNVYELYALADNMFDMSLGVLQVGVNATYNKTIGQINKSLFFENITDIDNVSFDCSVPIDKVNREGKHQSICRTKTIINDNKNQDIEVMEYWEKEYKTTTYGERWDWETNSKICEEVVAHQSYLEKYEITECVRVWHYVYEDNVLAKKEKWPYTRLPFKLAPAVYKDILSKPVDKRLTLTPWAEHVINAQKMLNYAATAQLYGLKNTRGTTKFMYPSESVEGHEEVWRNRNVREDDLTYELIRDPVSGEILPIKPEPIMDNSSSPTVSEVMSTYPSLISGLLGTDMEQDIAYNKSGEAIRQTQVIRYKNSKLWFDRFVEFLDSLAEDIEYYLPVVYDKPQYITINNFGSPYVEEINTQDDNMIKSKIEAFDIKIIAGSSPMASKEKTAGALAGLYQLTMGSPVGMQIQANTMDIFTSSMDTPDANDITKRIRPLVPDAVMELTSGQISEDESKQKQKAQQAQEMQSMQQEGMMKMQMVMKDMEAKMKAAEGRLLAGQAAVMRAQNEMPIEQLKSDTDIAIEELKQHNGEI